MNAAERVIEKFGGQSSLARLLGKGQTTVQHWSKTGVIPTRWQSKIMTLAQIRGVDLSAANFLPVPEATDEKRIATAKWFGKLDLGEGEEGLPVFVLDDGRRLISKNSASGLLTGTKSGDFDSYVRAEAVKDYMPVDLSNLLVEFATGVGNRTARGMEAETFMEVCRAYVKAMGKGKLSERQILVAIKASNFLAACAKIGIIALIDEATGYQYERAEDALRFKLKMYIADEMRQWEKTFPDELWAEFARLTNWDGSIHKRPKYWGKLVMELIYGYLDPDVAKWLEENAPKPRAGQNYHQWLTSQYGLKRLVEHIWMVIGIASACDNMHELRERLAERFGRQQVQLNLFLPPSKQIGK